MKNPVGWFEIYVDDMSRARKFYESVFDTQLTQIQDPSEGEKNSADCEQAPGFEMYGFGSNMESYGSSGALIKMADMPAGKNSVMVYFNCEDCAHEEARVETAGGKVLRPKFSIGQYGFISILNDSEGNMIGLHSQK